MIITHSTDVTLENVNIDRCLGFGVLFINPLGHTVTRNVSVTDTTSKILTECTQPTKRSDMLCSGSGIVFIFNDTDITQDLVTAQENYTASVSIQNCSIVNNTNFMPTSFLVDVLEIVGEGFATERILLTGGFSLAIYTGQRSYFVDVSVTDTEIISNSGNSVNCFVMYYNMLRMGATKLDRVVVRDNVVTGEFDLSRGGGLLVLVTVFFDMLNSFPPSPADVYDLVEVSRSSFIRNEAFYGGALMLYMAPQNVSNIRLLVRDTTFTENVASIGAALYVFQFQSVANSRDVFVYMEDVVASNNTFPGANISESSPENSAVFLVSRTANMTLVGTPEKGCHFVDNHMSVLGAVRANIVLRGRATFQDNHGFRGGALSLVDSSILFIHDGSDLAFTSNSAFLEGGAIYINTLGGSVADTCAIQFFSEKRLRITREDLQLLDLSIVFSNNRALRTGNSIFGNPLYLCFFVPTSSITHTNINSIEEKIIYEELFRYPETVGNGISELVSMQQLMCICKNTTYNSANCPESYSLDDPIIPGGTLILYLNPIDIARTPVASLLYSYARPVDPSHQVEIGINQDVRPLPGYTECTPVEFQIFAPENVALYLDLYTTIGGQRVTVELNTTACPPGFTLEFFDSKRPSCICSDFIERRLYSFCNLTDYTIVRPTNYWIGTQTVDDDGSTVTLFASTCPIDYCREDVTYVDLRVPDQLCTEGRTGILCGACREGLSSAFGTAECRECSNAWLATLPLFALLGALLAMSFFLLDSTITHGLVNGLFFYANIVQINSNIFFRSNTRGFLFWFASWLNLDLGFPLCFFDGMTESAKLGLQYVFPTYIMLMIALIMGLSQRSLMVQRIVSTLDGIHVLVTMSYIVFLKLVRTVIDTVTFVSLVSEDEEDGNHFVWFFDGTERLNDPLAIVFILVGTFTVVFFIIPYMVFFLFSTLIQSRVNSTRLNAYVDASLAPYRDKLRFWFGARLVLTIIIYIIIAHRGTNNPTLTLTLELSFLVGFTVIQAYIRPFKSLWVFLLDLSFLLNLIGLTLGVSYTAQSEERFTDQNVLINFSLGLALVTYLGILGWHLLRRLRRNDKFRNKTDEMLEMATTLVSALKLRNRKEIMEVIGRQREGQENSVGDEGGTRGASSGGRILSRVSEPPSSTTICLQEIVAEPHVVEHLSSSQLREPVLDFVDERHTA